MTHLVLAALLLLLIAIPAAAQAPPAADPPETTVDASRGGVTISSGVNSLRIAARAQVRWTVDNREAFDADTAGTGDGLEDDALSQFDVPSLRLTLSGGVYRPWLRYEFQFDLGRTSGEGGSRIKDAFIEIRPVGRNYRFVAGQFKVPFGLQLLNSSARLQFVDRAITHSKFNPARDMGAMFSGTAAGRRVGFDAGVFNGSGESVRQSNESHLWAGRVYLDPLGPYALAEGASDAGSGPVLHVGAAVRGGEAIRGRSAPGVVDDPDGQLAWNVEFAFKMPRFYSTAEHFWMTDEQRNPVPGPDIDSRGYHAQAGFMVVPRTTEIGILYSRLAPDTSADDADVSELRAVAGYYWQSHNLKLQADVGEVRYQSGVSALPARARQGLPPLGARLVTDQDLADTQVRVQMTLFF